MTLWKILGQNNIILISVTAYLFPNFPNTSSKLCDDSYTKFIHRWLLNVVKKTRQKRFSSTWTEVFLLHFSNTNSLITHCTHSEEEDISSMSVNKVTQSGLYGRVCKSNVGSLCSKEALQNAGIKSTQLMPLRVNTTHTMGVDVIDKNVGLEGKGMIYCHKFTGMRKSFHSLEDMQSARNCLQWTQLPLTGIRDGAATVRWCSRITMPVCRLC